MAKKQKYDELRLRKSTLITLPDGVKISVRILREKYKKLHSCVTVDRKCGRKGLSVLSRQDVISISWAMKEDFDSGRKIIVEPVRLSKKYVSLVFNSKRRRLYKIRPDKTKNFSSSKT